MDLTETIQAKSDQLNADDLIAGPRIVTITEVRRGTAEQPVEIVTAEFGPGRPFKPSKTVRRILVAAWGKDASVYTGRRMMLYRDPEVRFGGSAVGGIRVSALSDIDQKLTVALTVTRGRRAPHVVEPLPAEPERISPADLKQLNKLLTDTGLIEDRDQALALISKAAGRPIAATKELTPTEAQAVFAQIEKETDQ
ncbi:hypothetical protein [Gordonia alkanivorans]|uniref:hypothetical protein n=1 Tax=Gordonia alkanivorans TaxID=84096 RepID=UPI0024B81DF6|nr:hypothetical protein [Gordonia alkanivorans]MDJ0010132.1 hypothetical protein [Gordonia alkanivorans]MDJ0495678.1 hypothetical protein [Gordonia alkanivorans]